jgi:hypothetical protein
MIRTISQKQLPLSEFKTPFEATLDENNRWVVLSQLIPWDQMAEPYMACFHNTQGRPAKDARQVIAAVIIKHKLCLSDEETIAQIQENIYLQYFVGLSMYQYKAIFSPTLFVEIRKRMGAELFQQFEHNIIGAVEAQKAKSKDPDDSDKPPGKSEVTQDESTPKEIPHQGKLILDATVAEQAIRYPTDLSLLNEAREQTERMIDHLHAQNSVSKKPRTYRVKARKQYLSIVKRRRPGAKLYRKGNKQQLQYLRRNIGHIERLLDTMEALLEPHHHDLFDKDIQSLSLSSKQQKQYWIIKECVRQQQQMHDNKTKRCDDRIVSLSQPHVRPIIRGKQNKAVEFGAKLSVSLTAEGIACVDELRWDAFHEGKDLISQVERYRERHGYYPEKVLADPLYGTRENRRYLKEKGIHYAGKPLGRPKKQTEANKAELKAAKKQRHQDYVQRIPIEGKFGQGKNGYGLSKIKAKTAKTSFAWINSIFLVMNLLVLLRHFLPSNVIYKLMHQIEIQMNQWSHDRYIPRAGLRAQMIV